MSASKQPKAVISVQARDVDLLRGLLESRVMTAGQAAVLYFDGSREAAKKRLQKLKGAGLIAERARRAFEPSALFLKNRGLKLLRERGILGEYPPFPLTALDKRARVSDLTLRHELEVMDVKAAFHAAIGKTRALSVAEFSTWPLLYQFEAMRHRRGEKEVMVRPDGFIRVHEKEADGGLSEHTFFLEVDRSSETQDTLIARAGSYLDYFKSGGFAVRNGAPRSAYKEYPFRVLMVFKTAERRNNTAERLLQHNPPIMTLVAMTTLTEALADPLGAIWITPRDYQKAVQGTPFESLAERRRLGYQRDTTREYFIGRNILTCKIFYNQV